MATAPADDELPPGIARFWGEDGRVTGSGFLITERTLRTCAHVVANALGVDEAEPAPPAAPVTIDFPLLTAPSARLRATVTHWRAVAEDGGGDIALLSLAEPVPGTTPVRFAGGAAVWDHPFRTLGFPLRTDDHGVRVRGRLRAQVGKGWTSMEAQETPHGPAIGQGFSGPPVWDTGRGGVVGMTVAADVGSGATTAYLIPAPLLLGLDPNLRTCAPWGESRRPHGHGTGHGGPADVTDAVSGRGRRLRLPQVETRHMFRADGRVAAISTDGGVMLWDPDRDVLPRRGGGVVP